MIKKNYYKVAALSTAAAALLAFGGCGDSNGSSTYEYIVTPTGHVFDGNTYGVGGIKDMEVSDSGETLYAGTNSDTSGLVIINTTNGDYNIIDSGSAGRSVKLSADGQSVYVGGGSSETLYAVDRTTQTVTQEINLTSTGSGVALTDNGKTAYVGGLVGAFQNVNLETGDVNVTDVNSSYGWWIPQLELSNDESDLYLASSELLIYHFADGNYTHIGTNGGIVNFDVSKDNEKLYASNESSIQVIDLTTDTNIGSITEINATDSFGWIKGVKVTKDNRRLFIADRNYNDTLFMVNLENNNTVTAIMNESNITCYQPDSVEISPKGNRIYLGCYNGVIIEYGVK